MKVNKLHDSNIENCMMSSYDDVIKIVEMAKIIHIVDDVIAKNEEHPSYFLKRN